MKSNKAASAAAFHNKTIKAEESVVWLRWSSSSSCFKWVPIEAFPSNNLNLLVMMAFVMIFCRRCNTPLNVLWSAKIWLRWSRHSSVDPLSVLWTRVRSPSPPSMLFQFIFELWWEKDENKQRRVRDRPIFWNSVTFNVLLNCWLQYDYVIATLIWVSHRHIYFRCFFAQLTAKKCCKKWLFCAAWYLHSSEHKKYFDLTLNPN